MRAPSDWQLQTRSGARFCVPGTFSSMTSYVLLEQEAWFEPEAAWLPRLVPPGAQVLDIGANHGLYTVELARAVGPQGHVWAFEPTSVPRRRLQHSVRMNGLQATVSVVDAALAECSGTASFAVNEQSELNSRDGGGSQREDVRLVTLDEYLATAAGNPHIDFVKLDAEGSELQVLAGARDFLARQSPVLMFEFMHQADYNDGLVGALQALGFGIFRLAGELGVLVPFDLKCDQRLFVLNLFAVRPDRQRELAVRGLLVEPGAAADAAASLDAGDFDDDLQWLADCEALAGDGAPERPARDSAYGRALWAVARAHRPGPLPAADRLALLQLARRLLQDLLQGGQGDAPEIGTLAVHVHHALGEAQAALELAQTLSDRWPSSATVRLMSVPPLHARLHRPRRSAFGSWLRHCVAEFAALRSNWSTYFGTPRSQLWDRLVEHPDHDAETERRYLLSHMRANSWADPARLGLLEDPGTTCNAPLWAALVATLRSPPPAQGAR